MITFKDLVDVIESFPLNVRIKWGKMDFILEENSIQILDGKFVVGRYYDESRSIVINSLFIENKNHLRRVILHELAHSVGLSEKNNPIH